MAQDDELWGPDGDRPRSKEEAFLRAVELGDAELGIELRTRDPKLWVTDEQGRTALQIAQSWLAVDYEAELRRRLGVSDGDGDGDAVTVERIRVPDTGLGWWERIRVTAPDGRSLEVGTGHIELATDLERAFGIRTPCEELADRALSLPDDHHIGYTTVVFELVRRNDQPTLAALFAMVRSPDPRRRRFAADVLYCFNFGAGFGPGEYQPVALQDRIIEVLIERLREETDPDVLRLLLIGIYHHAPVPDRPEVLRHADHPDAGVRAAAARAMVGATLADHPAVVELLITMCADEAAVVRAPATAALGRVIPDTSEIRELLFARMHDEDPDVVWAAADALGSRDDPRADDVIYRFFLEDDADAPEAARGYIHIRRWSIERARGAREAGLGSPIA